MIDPIGDSDLVDAPNYTRFRDRPRRFHATAVLLVLLFVAPAFVTIITLIIRVL